MVNVIRGSSAKPVSSQRLGKYFEERTDIEGTLYIGYPIIGTPQGGYQIDALLVSRQQGVIIFNIDETDASRTKPCYELIAVDGVSFQ